VNSFATRIALHYAGGAMTKGRCGRRLVDARAALSLALVALAVVASIVAAGSVPHSHQADSVGLYNQEHDLSTLAALAGSAPLTATTTIAVALVASRPLSAAPAPRLASRPTSDDPSRAPPVSA
jgi:hypothetical protein